MLSSTKLKQGISQASILQFKLNMYSQKGYTRFRPPPAAGITSFDPQLVTCE